MDNEPFGNISADGPGAHELALAMVAEAEERAARAERRTASLLSMFQAYLAPSGHTVSLTAGGSIVVAPVRG